MTKQVKIKDLTFDEYEKWHEENCNNKVICRDCVFADVVCIPRQYNCWVKHKELYSEIFLEREIAVSLLNEKERKYLGSLIKPFANNFHSLGKSDAIGERANDYYSIFIILKTPEGDFETIILPSFPKDSDMYKGLEYDHRYTAEELHLCYRCILIT